MVHAGCLFDKNGESGFRTHAYLATHLNHEGVGLEKEVESNRKNPLTRYSSFLNKFDGVQHKNNERIEATQAPNIKFLGDCKVGKKCEDGDN